MYTAHEIRTAIRNCNTITELRRMQFEILLEQHNYRPLQLSAFDAAILHQEFKITKNYQV